MYSTLKRTVLFIHNEATFLLRQANQLMTSIFQLLTGHIHTCNMPLHKRPVPKDQLNYKAHIITIPTIEFFAHFYS